MIFTDCDEYISADVIVVGGGLGGCFAAIKAAEAGAEVALFEKAHIKRSGQTGTGIGELILIHPDYNISFEEFAKLNVETANGICDEDISYEFSKDTLDRLLDLESYGLTIRPDDDFHEDQFVMSEDVCPRKIRITTPVPKAWHDLKPVLAKKLKSFPNFTVFNRTAAVGLLTGDGAVGGGVTGAIGLGTRTGKFVICEAKAVILTSGDSYRLQRNPDTLYAPTRFITAGPPTNCGEGMAMAYRAGADIINMEFAKIFMAWKDFLHYGAPQLMIEGELKTSRGGIGETGFAPEDLIELYDKTRQGGFNTLGPFYIDASNVEESKTRKLLMTFENEGTSAGYLKYLKDRGEDVMKGPIELEWTPMIGLHNNQAGIHIDVNAKSSLEGLYCAGDLAAGGWRQSSQGGFVFGAKAGRNAAEYARSVPKTEINKEQAEKEKNRIREALAINPKDGYSWIELEDKARRIATDYGPPFTNDPTLVRGLTRLERIKTKYLPKLYARNPREMMRVSETKTVFLMVEAFLRAALFRKESRGNGLTMLYKTEYPEQDDKNWLKHTLIQNIDGEMKLSTRDVKRLKRNETEHLKDCDSQSIAETKM